MQTYQKKNHTPAALSRAAGPSSHTAAPPMDALLSGRAQPAPQQLGQRVDLPDQMRAKMERAFGADFSGVQLYRSQAVADAGAQAVTQGSRIAVAPDRLDFSSTQGQALLGHELSHVAAQARGEVRGQGFLHNAALESRADQEGAMAARGESFGPAVGSLSSASAVSAAGPMQAKKKDKPLPSTEGIDADLYERTEDEGFDWVGLGESVVSGFGSAAKQLEPEKLTKNAKSLRDAPIMKSTAGKAAGLMEKAAASDEIQRFGTAASIIGTANSAYGVGKAIFRKGEGDGMDRAANVAKGVMDLGVSSMDTASRFTSKITDASMKRAGFYNKIAKGSVDLVNAGRHGFMASTDNIMAQNALRSIRNEASNRTSQKERANDRTAEALLNSQQHAAGVHKSEALQQGIHAGLDVASGAAQFIPGVGKTISTGIGAVQTASDFVLNQEVEHRRKVGREANLGQERMDMLRTLTEKLVAERKAQCAAEGRSFTMFDADECQKLAKHTVNQKLYGEGARTNRMASLKKTNADVASMEQLMQQRGTDAEGELAAKRMTKAGHAIGDDGSFVDKNESLAKFNADFNGKSFEETYGAAESNEDSKYHLVQVARAKARKNAEEKAAKKAEKARLKAMTPEERKAAEAASKAAKAQAKSQAKEAKAQAKEQAKAEKEQNKGARAAQKQARRDARKQYRANRNEYVKKGMASEKNQGLGFFGRIAEKHRLKKAFDKDSEAKGVKDAAEGTASAGRRNPIKEMVLHAKRSHDRARDSIVNDGFDKLGAFDHFKIAAANPLAWIASKTASGKAKSDPSRRASGEQRSAALLDEIMGAGSAPEPAPASAPDIQESATDGDQMADPYLLSVQDKVDRFNSGHANNDKVDPSKLSFKNKIRHLNRRRR